MMRNTSVDFAIILSECITSLAPGWKTEELVDKIINTLADKKWSIVPPDHILLPTSPGKAEAMILAAEGYLKGYDHATTKEA
jgi:hypothetical protein